VAGVDLEVLLSHLLVLPCFEESLRWVTILSSHGSSSKQQLVGVVSKARGGGVHNDPKPYLKV
jgi:hypothetical protein